MIRNVLFLAFLMVFLPLPGCETNRKEPGTNTGEPEAIQYIHGELPPDSTFLKSSKVPKAYGERIFIRTSIQAFPEFWEVFGKALRTRDYTRLDYYIAGNLNVDGHEDRDPKFTLTGKKRIDKLLEIYENGGFYDLESDQSLSYEELFKRKAEEIRDYKKEANMQWMEEFIFENKGSGWKLVSVFCDTRHQ